MTLNNLTDILLESGTNELEIVEFTVGQEFYGINVAKVSEIIRIPDEIVPVPNSQRSISGMINLRGQIVPIINLAIHLNMQEDFDSKRSRIIVTEFNQTLVGFWVSTVTRIHRISWTQVEKPSSLMQNKSSNAVGIIKMNKKILLLLDFEMITTELSPGTGMRKLDSIDPTIESNLDRATRRILIAEDSNFIGEILVQNIRKAGYKLELVTDGLQAWEILQKLINQHDSQQISAYYNLLITDIEMPLMDGLHLVKLIKENIWLKKLPCVIFSSMINSELAVKCKAVGADAMLSKPELAELIRVVDGLVL